jgi:hypothetical protein
LIELFSPRAGYLHHARTWKKIVMPSRAELSGGTSSFRFATILRLFPSGLQVIKRVARSMTSAGVERGRCQVVAMRDPSFDQQ